MDYAALKAADAALGIADPGAAAAALNAQTVELTVDIATGDARAVLLLSGEWYKVKALAKQTPTDTLPATLVGTADVCVDTLTLTETLHTTDDATWAVIQQMAGALVQAGVLSQQSLASWTALRTRTQPRWPVLDAGMIQTARVQP